MVDIKPEHFSIIKNIIFKNNIGCTFFVFGSRAKNCAKPFSDLDLAVDCKGNKANFSILAKLRADFENSILPYSVDLIDLNAITKEFRQNIEKDLVKLEI